MRDANELTETHQPLKLGWLIQDAGILLFIASVLFGLLSKSNEWSIIAFFSCVVILIGVAAFYLIARTVSTFWKSQSIRAYFGPYLVGSTIWIVLIGLLWSLYRYS